MDPKSVYKYDMAAEKKIILQTAGKSSVHLCGKVLTRTEALLVGVPRHS